MICRVCLRATLFVLAACLIALPPFAFGQTVPASVPAVLEALQQGQYDNALRMCGELLRAQPRSEKLWTLRAVGLERSGHPKEALAAYQHALSLAPNYLPALEGAAQLEYKAQSAQAVLSLRRIVSVQPDNATAHAMLGVLEYRQKDYVAAAEDFAAAGDLPASQPEALMAYAICLVHLNRGPEAIAHLQQLLALQPTNADARYDLALLQWRSSAEADALSTLQPLLDARPVDARAMRLAAAIHESNSETPQAVELLRAAILAHPDDPVNYLDFATLAFTHGSYAVGVDIVSAGLTRLPRSAALYMARGVLYGQNGDFDKAMADFARANTLDTSYSMAASAEGIAQSQRHNHQEALEDFRRQVREHPKNAFGYYLLAEALSWSPPDAKPDDNRQSVQEAIAAAAKAVELDPGLVQANDLLGSLYLQTGQLDLAVKACRAALRINPKDQQAIYSLILALRKTGDKQELKALVQTLTSLRKAEQTENGKTARYGRLIEEP
ncbi:MAG: tetratricopeptide repeat protein [Terracidiphilus sp.]